MFTIRNYTDTKCELEMAKTRLNLLIDKKISIYNKYFPITSTIKEVMVDGGERNNDKMTDYVAELNEIDIGTGMSISGEMVFQQKKIEKFENYLATMDDILSKMSGIEFQLFHKIVYKGLSITKAVEKVAEENDKDTSTIWKNYYNKIKKDIKRIANFSKV